MKAGEWYSGRASGYNFIVRAKPLIAEADEKDYYNLHFRGYSTDFDIRIPTEELNNYLTECEKPDHSRKHPIPPPRSYLHFRRRIGIQNPVPSPRLPSSHSNNGPSMHPTPKTRQDRPRSRTPPRFYDDSPSRSASNSPLPMGRRQNREERNRESRSQSRWRGVRNERDESDKIPIKPIKAEVESDDDLQIVSWTLNESSDRRLIEEKEKQRKREMAERQRKREQKREQGGGAPSPHFSVFAQTIQKTEPDASVKDNSWPNPPPPPGCFPPPGYFPYPGYPYYGYPHHPQSPANMGYSPAQPIPGSPIPDPNMMYGFYNPFYPYASPQQLHPPPPQGFQQPLQPHPYFGQPPYAPAIGSAYGQQPSTPLPYDTATPRRPPNRGIPSLPTANEDATNMPEAAPLSGSLPREVQTSNEGDTADAETNSNVEMSTRLTSLITLTQGTSTVSAGSVVLDTVPQQREASIAVSSAAAPVVNIYSTPKITHVVVEDSTNSPSESNSRPLPVVDESVNEQRSLSSIGSAVTIDQSIQSAVFSDDEENDVEMEKETTEVVPSSVVLETVPVTEDRGDAAVIAPLSQQIVTDENQIVSASVPPLTPCHTIQLNEGSGNVVQSDVMEMVDDMEQSNTSEQVIEKNVDDVSSDDTANVMFKDNVREETVQPTPSPSCDPPPKSHNNINRYVAILAAMKVTMDSELQNNGMASELIQKINQFVQSNIVVQVEESVQSVSSTHSEVPVEDATPSEHSSISSEVLDKEKEVPLEDATPPEHPSISSEVLDKEKDTSNEKDVSLEDEGGHPDPEHPSTSSEFGQEEENDTTKEKEVPLGDAIPPEHPAVSSDALEKENETTNGKDSDVPLEDDGHPEHPSTSSKIAQEERKDTTKQNEVPLECATHPEHPAMSSDALEKEKDTANEKDLPLGEEGHPEHPSTSSEIGQEQEKDTMKEQYVPLEDGAHSEHPSISSGAVLDKEDETAKEKDKVKVDNVDVGQSVEMHRIAKLEPFEIDYGCLMVDMSMYSTIPSIEDDSTDYIDMEEEMNEMSQMMEDEEEKEEEDCEEQEENIEKENEEIEENEKEVEMEQEDQPHKDSEESVELDKLTLKGPDLVEDVLGSEVATVSEALESEKNVEKETLVSVELSTEELVLVERVVGIILDEVCVDIGGTEKNEVEEHDQVIQVDQIASGDLPSEVVSNGNEEVPVTMDAPVKIEMEDDYLSAIGPSDLSISSSNRSRLGDDLPEDLAYETEDSFGTANYCSSSPRTISSPPLEREEMILEEENEEEKKDDKVEDSECDEYLTDDDEKNESDQSTVELDSSQDIVVRSIEEQSADDFAESEKADTDGLEDTNEDTDDTNSEETKEKKVHWKSCVEVVELSDEDEDEDEDEEEEEDEETEEGNCQLENDVEEREEDDIVEISDDDEKEKEVEKEDEVVCCEIVVNTEKEKNVDCNSGEEDDIVEISDDEEEDNQEYCEFVEEETPVHADNNREEDELYEIEENNMVNERDEQEESVEKEEEEEVVRMDSDKGEVGDEKECVESGEEERKIEACCVTDGGEENEKGDEEENEDEDNEMEEEDEEEKEPPVKRIRLDPGSFGILKGLVKGKCSVDEDEGDVKPSREFVLSIRNSCADVVDNNNVNVVNRVDVDERENGASHAAISSSGSSSEHDNVVEERPSSEHYSSI